MNSNIVAIQTPHYAYNYGAQLQAYALGMAIKSLGYDIEYIDRRPPYYFESSHYISRLFKHLERRTRGRGFEQFEKRLPQPKIRKKSFINKDYPKTKRRQNIGPLWLEVTKIWRDDYFFHSFEYSPYLYFFKKWCR